MLNPTQTIIHIDNTASIVTINSGEHIDFSISTLDINGENVDNLTASIMYISPIANLETQILLKAKRLLPRK